MWYGNQILSMGNEYSVLKAILGLNSTLGLETQYWTQKIVKICN